jgi:hypothetical protein
LPLPKGNRRRAGAISADKHEERERERERNDSDETYGAGLRGRGRYFAFHPGAQLGVSRGADGNWRDQCCGRPI